MTPPALLVDLHLESRCASCGAHRDVELDEPAERALSSGEAVYVEPKDRGDVCTCGARRVVVRVGVESE